MKSGLNCHCVCKMLYICHELQRGIEVIAKVYLKPCKRHGPCSRLTDIELNHSTFAH